MYSGAKAIDLNATGESVFRGQLYLSMIGQALQVKSQIEIFRSQNRWGVITWQLGEVRLLTISSLRGRRPDART